jgi:hypothetical protein
MRHKMSVWRMAQLFFALSIVLASSATAGTLTDAEVAHIKADIALMIAALSDGDADKIIERTHPSLYEIAGGREAVEKLIRDAMEQIRVQGVKVVHSEVGTPARTYSAGEEEVCFVPKVTVMEVQGKQMKSTNFMIAIRRVGAKEWKYLEGAGLRTQPELLSRLLPKLESGVLLPENKIEEL